MSPREIIQRRFVGSIAALVAGMLLSLAFAPLQWWPLAVAAPAALMWLWQGAAPRRAAVLGFWFNAGTFSVGTYWLYISIAGFGQAPLLLTLFLMAGLVGIMGAYHALLGWAVARFLPERGAARWLLGIPAMWLMIEWVRSWFLTGFGWLALGYSQTDTWLAGYVPVIGQYGTGWLVLLMAGGLLTLLLGSRRERILAIAVIAVPWGGGYLLHHLEWTRASGSPISVAVVQGAISQDEKWIANNLQTIMGRYRELTRTAHGADLIVWPESAAPDLANNLVDWYAGIYAEASAHGSSLIVGTLRVDEHDGEEQYFNSVLSMDRNAAGVGWHDKHHLVPFVEFFPVPGFVRSWLRLMHLPYSDFERGARDQAPLIAAGQKIAASVCYEDAYGSTQLAALPEATMLVNVTNDGWFGRSSARYQHLQIARMRAMEASRPMVRAANDGVSALIDHRGGLVARAPEYEAHVLRGDVQPRTGLTPYAHTGNWPVITLALAMALGAVSIARHRKQP